MSITPTRAAAWTAAILAAPARAGAGALRPPGTAAGRHRAQRRPEGDHPGQPQRPHALQPQRRSGRGGSSAPTARASRLWHPLVVAKGIRPTGKVPLGTIRRPDGRIQVTFKGAPLYTFAQDTKAGQTNGEGFKDVGVWRATTVGAAAAAPQSKPSPDYSY